MKIKSGTDFALLLTDRGEVYSWGKNDVGQLGIGTIDDDYHKPTKIDFILDVPIKYISAGGYHAVAIDFDYNVYAWGYNFHGQLGLGYRENKRSPTIIECLKDKRVEKIYCTVSHTYALTQNGEVYSWGYNFYGRLGLGNNNDTGTPSKINFPDNTTIKNLYIGFNHIFAIDTASNIYSWGNNYSYQLCKGNNIGQNSPSIANMLEDFIIEKIICLRNSTIILADNKLYSIGCDNFGELGLGIEKTNKLTIIVEGVEKVWGNDCTVFCKMMNGDVYAWGLNHHGQLGIGNKKNQNIPVKLNIDLDIKSINNYGVVTYAITTSGEIYTWGNNGLVNKKSIMEPTLFTYFTDNDIDIKYINRTKSARKKIDY